MLTTDPIKQIDRTFDDMKGVRLSRETEWQQIADHFLPRKDFSVKGRPTDLRKRRLTSSIPAVSLRRSAAMLAGYMIDPTQPFIRPNAELGLVAAGRRTDLDADSRDFLSTLSWSTFDHMMRPKSGYLSSIARVSLELLAFGTAVQWTGRKRGFGPVYHARPMRSCWIQTNADGEVDTLYYEFTMKLWQVLQRFENARYVEGWTAPTEAQLRSDVVILHTVEPRQGGEKGAVATRKPWAERYVCLDKKALLEERGYDSFPYSVPRLDVEDGSPYGTGLCWLVLPDAIALSTLGQGVENAVDLRVNPPILRPARMFPKPLDRRAGADNQYDPSHVGFQSAREAVQRLDIAGDVGVGAGQEARYIQNIEMGLLTDWMRLREAGNVTAEEIIERRDLRIRAMSAFIPGVDRDLMGTAADRTVEILFAENRLPDPPASLAGINVEWDYGGPLAQAQMQRQAEAFGRVLDMAIKAAQLDPSAAYVLAIEEGLRAVADAYGTPSEGVRSREAVEELRARDAEREAEAREAEQANQAATALRDGAQGVASLRNAGQRGQQQAA